MRKGQTMRLCDETNRLKNYKPILDLNYNNDVEKRVDIVYKWMKENKDNAFVQDLGSNWLKTFMRYERERILFR